MVIKHKTDKNGIFLSSTMSALLVTLCPLKEPGLKFKQQALSACFGRHCTLSILGPVGLIKIMFDQMKLRPRLTCINYKINIVEKRF